MDEKHPRPRKELKIPTEFLATFQKDVRIIPTHLPVAGYITFDRQMLIEILRSKDPAARENFAATLQQLDREWEIALITPTEQTTIRG